MADSATLVCAATDFELALLREQLNHDSRIRFARMGIGAVNAAHAVTLAVAQDKPQAILVCGIGGAYPSSGLSIGDVVCAKIEIYGDLGAQSPTGFLDMKALGFPVVDSAGSPLFNEIPMQLFPSEHRVNFVT